MRRLAGRIAALTIVSALSSGLDVPADDRTYREQVEVRRVRIPVLLRPRVEGGCDRPDPAWIEVLEDGAAVRAVALERSRLRTFHTILLDTSESMTSRIGDATAAAGHYLSEVPRDEPALLATFDDSMQLRVCRSRNLETIRRNLERIRTVWGTALWESTRQMIEYLRSSPERKVLVILTDGCDSHGAEAPPASDVIDLAAHTENLTIFVVGIHLPAVCGDPITGHERPQLALQSLAHRTGGKFYAIEMADELHRVLPEIRERIDSEGYVTYEPLPFGSGPKDRPDRQPFRWRKLRIRTSEDSSCRADLAGSSLRYEGEGRGFHGGAPMGDPGANAILAAPGPDGTVALGDVEDRVEDTGLLYRADTYLKKGRFRIIVNESPQSRTRPVSVLVPPLERVVEQALTPAQAVRYAMAHAPDATHWTEIPYLVNGRTFLEARATVASALFAQPDYRRFALQRARAGRIAMVADVYADADHEARTESLDRLRAAYEGDDWSPDPGEIQEYLAAWLGDIPVLDVATAVDARLAREMVAAEDGAARSETLAEAQRIWDSLATWFPVPTEVRILALLVPGYDEDNDAIGFHRIVLPMEREIGRPAGMLTKHPYGVHVVRWFIEAGAAGDLPGGATVRTVRYVAPSRGDLERLRKETRESFGRAAARVTAGSWRTVTIGWGDAVAPDAAGWALVAHVPLAYDGSLPAHWAPFAVGARGESETAALPTWVSQAFERLSRDPYAPRLWID